MLNVFDNKNIEKVFIDTSDLFQGLCTEAKQFLKKYGKWITLVDVPLKEANKINDTNPFTYYVILTDKSIILLLYEDGEVLIGSIHSIIHDTDRVLKKYNLITNTFAYENVQRYTDTYNYKLQLDIPYDDKVIKW